jgi:hypothetical protein
VNSIVSPKFVTRHTDPYLSIKKVQDRQFPKQENLSYDNYLVAIKNVDGYYEYDFVMRDGTSSQY